MRFPLAIWGTSGHARVVADVIRCGTEFEVVGFLDDANPDRRGQRFCDATVLGGREQLASLAGSGVRHIVLGFGNNAARRRLGGELRAAGFSLARAVHPRATVASDVRVGDGTVVMAGAVVNPNASLGENVIVNTGATVDHDCVLGDAVHVSPGAHLAGSVRVGDETWIGLGALVLERRHVGGGSIVGAGAVVTHDIPNGVVAMGVPARVVRKCGGHED
ncbi:MAG: acetyltransferase [Deltaproteobacteria bacterium]|nr:acetyltransferase [Deltaproteobacteria bacterium]